jgi:hypothetical protein
VPKRLYVKDFEHLRHRTTQACLEQRRFLDLARTHERERPYPLPSFAGYKSAPDFATLSEGRHDAIRYSSAVEKPRHAPAWGRYEKQGAFHAPRGRPSPPLYTCTCPRCEAVHVHHVRDPVHQCSCGLVLHRGKQLSLQRKGAAQWER